MKRTIFTTPIVTDILRGLFGLAFRILGWRVDGSLPTLPKFVLIGAPHTSNWDFMIFLALAFHLRVDARYMGKAELFRWPIGGFFRYCGGYPVERNKSQGLVEQMAQIMKEAERFILVIAPEGTRHKVHEWKTGFYHIARRADVPVVTAYIDSSIKACGIGPTFELTDNLEADIKSIQSFYAGKAGVHPHETSEL
ncbi:MAG: lysophospholipid acyltransferase family protein [Chloroflexi bacterium]|nr:lysophospholipid acyltransferase family protein [Chloroflexota bacterium]